MPQKICLLYTLRPEFNSIAKGIHGLLVATNKGSTKVDVREVVLFGLKVSNLANVVAIETGG